MTWTDQRHITRHVTSRLATKISGWGESSRHARCSGAGWSLVWGWRMNAFAWFVFPFHSAPPHPLLNCLYLDPWVVGVFLTLALLILSPPSCCGAVSKQRVGSLAASQGWPMLPPDNHRKQQALARTYEPGRLRSQRIVIHVSTSLFQQTWSRS